MSFTKQKGTTYETNIVKYLKKYGFTSARRVALSGASGDKGDIHIGEPNNPIFVIECKNYAKELPYGMVEGFLKEAQIEYYNAHKELLDTYPEESESIIEKSKTIYSLLFVKRPNLGVADSWVIWKNHYGITIRCRLGDIINDDTMESCFLESDCIYKLKNLLMCF